MDLGQVLKRMGRIEEWFALAIWLIRIGKVCVGKWNFEINEGSAYQHLIDHVVPRSDDVHLVQG